MRRWRLLLVVSMLAISLVMAAGCGNKDKTAGVSADKKGPEQSVPAKSSNDIEKLMANMKALKGYSCEMTMTGAEAKELKSKLWASGERIRMEMEADGVKSIMIMNSKGELWSYMPTENVAMKMASAPETALPTDWAENEEKPQIVGNEKVDGVDCLIVTVAGDKDTRCWLMKETGLPVKIESIIEGKKNLIVYKNYNIGAQADDLFELPAGAQVVAIPGSN